ncbi:hypothetical protein BK816_03890 [Boudabousia tangfeifanii]|uniref:Ribonuclease n=1 Tax=Boudabousia tangfeifanii TaxID=1912795 RepID=A0A1D9MJR9_9ACTO|nr:ribonuclease HII [Boudabousia tangfeifanii]AOZ72544.1 hypothetical protein BK816_03890 [Boudabousia tangfeifanii]
MTKQFASSQFEQELLRDFQLVGGMDEVGRGALAGPVGIGLCVISAATKPAPPTLADSKLLAAKTRESLVSVVEEWAEGATVTYGTSQEIDQLGIIGAQRLAGWRALEQMRNKQLLPSVVILDGCHDWLSPPQDLFASMELETQFPELFSVFPKVIMRVKADRDLTVVAAASVLAKVSRDAFMKALPDPGYGWAQNVGYGTKTHLLGLDALGPSEYHRMSWKVNGQSLETQTKGNK